ncbi:hypothetical protein NLU13_8038 [Sarocladium strictum]|uniref:PPM-type phosphatase domain-containing protein n=1 Tax=Sarocladium strictum TaxID=5046 RepID=A0AA39GAW5_SARSR|nr:hypothetical protein NLU13_8038 [Sarocladium strictum]
MRAAQFLLRSLRRQPHLLRSRSFATQSTPAPAAARRLIQLAGTVVFAGCAGYTALDLEKRFSQREQPGSLLSVPSIPDVASASDIEVATPVKALSLEEANAKLRQEVRSLTFETKDGAKGRVDSLRIASNDPVEDELAVGIAKGVDGQSNLFVGVYDGHAGWATSSLLTKTLIPYVSAGLQPLESSSSGDAIDDAIKRSFISLDKRIDEIAIAAIEKTDSPLSAEAIAAVAPAAAGSCALLTIYDPRASILRTAVAGDSRAVLGSWSASEGCYGAKELSKDQTGFNVAEKERIAREHPNEDISKLINAESGRLLGIAITRAFGDNRWKWSEETLKKAQAQGLISALRPNYVSPPYITAEPEVTAVKVQTEDFAILASDGLWDVMSSEDAVKCVSLWLDAKRRPGKAPPSIAGPGTETQLERDAEDWPTWKATPENFVIEDLDNAAVCLVKNAFGGTRRELFRGVMTAHSPMSRNVRDDVTVQVIFFAEP